MKKSPYTIFLVMAFAIFIMAILYQFRIVSEWKLAVLTISSVLYTWIDTWVERTKYRKKTAFVQALYDDIGKRIETDNLYTEEEVSAILSNRQLQEKSTTKLWNELIYYIPFVILIIGMSLDISKGLSVDVNTISAIGIALSSLAIYQKKEVGERISEVENELVQLVNRMAKIRQQRAKE